MPDSLSTLESRRAELLRSIAHLNDMRPGSIVGAVWRCRKPTCHCAQPDDSAHPLLGNCSTAFARILRRWWIQEPWLSFSFLRSSHWHSSITAP